MAFLIATEDTNVEVGKDVEILFTGIYPYPNEMKVFVNGVQKTNGISYNYTSQGMVRSFTISFSESGTYDVYVIYNDTILLQHSNTLTFTTKDNKTNIILNHKEVQSIQLTDGGIIYQRPIFKQIGSFTVSPSNETISFADNESTTITATVLDNNDNPISNEFILFEVDNGEYIDTFTDENGEASIIYESKNWGDVEITANCRELTETLTIQDCYFFDDYDGSKTSHYTAIRSSPSFSNSIATFPRTSSSQSYYILNDSLNFDYEIEIGFVKYSGNYIYRMAYFEGSTRKSDGQTYSANEGKFWGIYGDIYAQLQTGDVIKYKITQDKLEFYLNNVLKGTNTNSTTISNYIYGKNIGFNHDNNIGIQIDYIKIKPLYSISVDVDNPVLSYIDGDTAILTATITPIAQGKTVKIYKDNVLIDTKQTNEYGQVTYEYSSQGVEDVEFTFECGALSETVIIEDIFKYDGASVDNTSKYSSTNTSATLTYDTTNKHYILTNQRSSAFGFMSLNDLMVSDDVEISVDMCIPLNNASNVQPRFTIMNSASNVGVGLNLLVPTSGSSNISLRRIVPNGEGNTIYSNVNITASRGNWYTIKLKVNGDTFIGEAYDGDTLLNSVTSTITGIISDTNNVVGIQHCYTQNAVCYWKNLKIKSLLSLSLDVDNPILSFADEDSAILTATLSPVVQGKTVKIYKDDTLVATEITDSQGQVSYTYESQGVGEVEFTFECGVSSETIIIDDFTKKYALDSSTGYTNNSSGYGSTVITDGVYSGGASFLSETFDGSGDWTVKMDIKFATNGCGVGIQYGVSHNRERSIVKINSGGGFGYNNSPNGWYTIGSFSLSTNIWYPVTFEKKGNTITCYCNNLNFSTSAWEFTNSPTLSVGTDQWGGSGSPVSFRNLRIWLG